MYLYIYEDNWADEFNFQAWEVSETDWLTPLKRECELARILDLELEYSIGTNQEMFLTVGDLLSNIKVIEGVTAEQNSILTHLTSFTEIPIDAIHEALDEYRNALARSQLIDTLHNDKALAVARDAIIQRMNAVNEELATLISPYLDEQPYTVGVKLVQQLRQLNGYSDLIAKRNKLTNELKQFDLDNKLPLDTSNMPFENIFVG